MLKRKAPLDIRLYPKTGQTKLVLASIKTNRLTGQFPGNDKK